MTVTTVTRIASTVSTAAVLLAAVKCRRSPCSPVMSFMNFSAPSEKAAACRLTLILDTIRKTLTPIDITLTDPVATSTLPVPPLPLRNTRRLVVRTRTAIASTMIESHPPFSRALPRIATQPSVATRHVRRLRPTMAATRLPASTATTSMVRTTALVVGLLPPRAYRAASSTRPASRPMTICTGTITLPNRSTRPCTMTSSPVFLLPALVPPRSPRKLTRTGLPAAAPCLAPCVT